ncbi:MAG TPA: leucine--tRNA ligase [Gaiellaceae bacterium]|nr:leucine--tRNA ligase [Gaiellaceae bacterium]
MDTYEPQKIEPKWEQVWEDARAFYVPNPDDPGRESREKKFYMLEMLPYPSGTLHMGHVFNYTLGDVLTHYHRRTGKLVLRPMGFDSFGLPAENAAIREGGHPREIIERNIAHIRRGMRRLGWAIDWDREASAHEVEYYRWTQWLFLKFFEAGLAYRKEAPVNWCPFDQTVVANEYVIDGRCERCGTPVEARLMEQWFFRITAYADQLLHDLELIDWPERTKTIQRNWIGRSEGAEILWRIEELDIEIPAFTTRPDTLFGATFFALSPEHPLVERLVAGTEHEAVVTEYVRRTAARSREERETKEKDGVFTGRFVVNPANGERIPVWVADFVLMDYGTGAIGGVPAHDERDYEFAKRFELPLRRVVEPAEGAVADDEVFVAHTEDERLVNSGDFSGLPAPEGGRQIVDWLHTQGRAAPTVRYRLRDWSFSRQRYWGCPIPVVYCEDDGIVAVPEEDLPVELPEVEDYRPKGMPPLASNEEWMNVPCPRCGKPARREADTMDTFVDSSWYFLRYCDPRNDSAPFDRDIVDYWMPVDQYVGGIDHATGHLLYSRFFVKALNDFDLVGFREPFQRLFHQGWVRQGGTKMSKSKGNVTGPDQLVDLYGADAVRLYILFMGPADQDMEWTEEGVEGISRFLRRLWRTVNEVIERAPAGGEPEATPLAQAAHRAIAKVTDDIDRRFQFNTPIAAVMELVNEIARTPEDPAARFASETAVSLVQPYAPHIAEELWEWLGHERLWEQPWPEADPAMLERETFELVIQVNGKVRDRVQVASEATESELVEQAKASPRVQSYLDGKQIRKEIVVPGKLVNLVID